MNSALANPPVVKPKAISCPNCGGPVELRGFANTLSVVCPSCHSILDTSTPAVRILQQVQIAERIQPTIPLGSRGTFENTPYEAIGYQIRDTLGDEGDGWSEYVLFNPYKGFRYLAEYKGHWSYIRAQTAFAQPATKIGTRRQMALLGRVYKAFDSATAVTSYVLGEFPWRVKVGERVRVEDYIAPPHVLSGEITSNEAVWSVGEYYTGAQIWQAFKLPGAAPAASGIYLNQPSPYTGRVGSAWNLCLLFLVALAAMAFFFAVRAQDKQVFDHSYSFVPGSTGEASFVTDYFDVTGKTSNVQVKIDTDLDNSWIYLNLALINADTGQAFDFGREVSYYHGVDSDGSWSEGSTHSSVKVPGVPPGRYYLRVEPENDGTNSSRLPIRYDLELRRDVPTWSWYWIAAVLILIPPIFTTVRSASFETARWRESDFVPGHAALEDD